MGCDDNKMVKWKNINRRGSAQQTQSTRAVVNHRRSSRLQTSTPGASRWRRSGGRVQTKRGRSKPGPPVPAPRAMAARNDTNRIQKIRSVASMDWGHRRGSKKKKCAPFTHSKWRWIALRNTFGARSAAPIHRTDPLKSTFPGKSRARTGWSRRSRQSTSSREGPPL